MTDGAERSQKPHTPREPRAVRRWTNGQLVLVRGDRWRVEGSRCYRDCEVLRLAGVGRANRGSRVALLYPFDRPRPLQAPTHLQRVGWQAWLRRFAALVVTATPQGRLRTARTARIQLLDYQLEPALAILNGLATRVLLADSVGLGKTIQAGLVVSELRARDPASRVLILTPAGLRDQWASELRDRFAIDAAVVDAAMVRATLSQVGPGTNPWSVWPVAIASLDFVKRSEVLRALAPFTWDALLVDEAHTCAIAPDRSAAARTLAARARLVLLLTATPHAGDERAFEALCGMGRLRGCPDEGPSIGPVPGAGLAGSGRQPVLHRTGHACRGPEARNDAVSFSPTVAVGSGDAGDVADGRTVTATNSRRAEPGASEAIVLFRRSRRDVGLPSTRRVHLLRVRCSAAERSMHRLLEGYTRAVWTSADAGREARLAMIVLRKRAFSSATSLARSLERRLEALFDIPPAAAQLALPFAGTAPVEDQTLEDDEPEGCLAAPGIEGWREREWLTRVLHAARRAIGRESKLRRLARLLARARQPAVVFTEYRDTARWLAGALGARGPVVLLHGGLSRDERRDAERRFRTGDAVVLVATDAAGEGVNLQHRCRLVVNLELPWNPMRLEQRIGRVDRLGQQRRPHAVHLVGLGTAEESIVRRLVIRQRRAERAIGSVDDAIGPVADDEVAEAVMRGGLPRAGADRPQGATREADIGTGHADGGVFRTIDLRALAREEVARLDALRSVDWRRGGGQAGGAEPASDAEPFYQPCIATLPRRRAHRTRIPDGLICVLTVRLLSPADGDVLDECTVPLRVQVAGAAADIGRDGLDALLRSGLLRRLAIDAAGGRLTAARDGYRRALLAATARERAMAAPEQRPAAALQPGMFDGRAVRAAKVEATERVERAVERVERLERLRANTSGHPRVRSELALVLVVDRHG